ncbi:MAG TPA: hypothetical protein VI358_20765 [Pseudolabrys sp.]
MASGLYNRVQIPFREFEYKSLIEMLPWIQPLNKSNDKRSGRDGRTGHDRRSELFERSGEEMLLGIGRFSCHAEYAGSASTASVVTDRKIRKSNADKRSDSEQRSGRERRCGSDGRSEVEQFLQGERRSGLDRRKRRYRSFKKARAFVRGLGLKSAGEWRDYIKSGMKPDDIPVAPHHVYANDGWAGWSDWLEAGTVASYLSQYRYRSFKKARALARELGLVSSSEWRAYCKSAKKPDDIPANPKDSYAGAGWAGWGDWLGHEP